MVIKQFLDHGQIVRLGKKLRHSVRHHIPDTVNVHQVGIGLRGMILRRGHGVQKLRRRPVGACQGPRGGLSHMANAERKDETVQADRAALVNGGKQLVGRRAAPAFTVFQFLQ